MAEFIKNHIDTRSKNTQSIEELTDLQEESKEQKLPEQSKIFGVASLRKTHRAATNLPDPTNAPLGFDPQNAFDNIFPFVRVPYLQPKTNEDIISFGSPDEGGYLDPKSKKIPLNSIFFGDNLHTLRALPSNSIDLIYIDPPFFSGREYNQVWGDDNEIRTFNDIWEDGLPSYLVWLNARLWEMRRVLKNTGSIYVHCDWHASHYIKVELDKIFGYNNFQNEIIWERSSSGSKAVSKKHFARMHDTIYRYSKGPAPMFTPLYEEYDQEYIDYNFIYKDERGRFRRQFIGTRGKQSIEEMRKDDRIITSRTGKNYLKQYLHESKGVIYSDFWVAKKVPDLRRQGSMTVEDIGYPTQKPEVLMERIISGSSKKGDIVADFFMGGGTTLAVAMKQGRKFIGCDISRVAASVTLDRLVGVGEDITKRPSSATENKTEKSSFALGLFQDQKVPNIYLSYIGTYPVEKFANIEQKTFNEFILTCYGARIWTGSGNITGVMNAATTVLVGPANPKENLKPDTIKDFVQDSLKQRIVDGIQMKLKIIAWSFPRAVQKYCRTLERYLEKNSLPVTLELIPLSSEQFRHRIIEQYNGKSVTDSDFLLKFIVSPTIGNIAVKTISDRSYQFTAEGSHSNNLDGVLINCQWDFDFKDGRFSEKEYALMREKETEGNRKGMYKAVLSASKNFEKAGEHIIACRVQDNLGAEAIITKTIEVK